MSDAQDRLLTPEEVKEQWLKTEREMGFSKAVWDSSKLAFESEVMMPHFQNQIKAQDTKTAALKDAECQARISALIAEIEGHFNADMTCDQSADCSYTDNCIEGIISEDCPWWQSIKQSGSLKNWRWNNT